MTAATFYFILKLFWSCRHARTQDRGTLAGAIEFALADRWRWLRRPPIPGAGIVRYHPSFTFSCSIDYFEHVDEGHTLSLGTKACQPAMFQQQVGR